MTPLHAPRVKRKSPGLLTVPQHTHRTQSHSHLHAPIELRKHLIATTPTFQYVTALLWVILNLARKERKKSRR